MIWTIMPLSLIFLLTLYPCLFNAQTSPADVDKIIEAIDELYRSESSFSEITMQVITPHWERTLQMRAWTKGKEKTFIRITSPPKENGVATLRIGNEMWNFLPKINKVMKIPPSMMMSSWMGSDFTNDDLVKEFTFLNDYTHELIHPQESEEGLLYILFTPKENLPIIWGKVITVVRESDHIPVWEKYYDEKGKLMRVINFKDIQKMGGRTIPTTMELIPQTKEGHSTLIQYRNVEFNIDISDTVFSLRNLRSRERK